MPVEIIDHEMKEIYQTALDIAKKAGEMINEAFHKEKNIDMKDNIADLVTETDKAVEKTMIGLIMGKYPSHKIIGEETVAETGDKCELTDEPTWIMDPVDGTTNFIHTIPDVAFSLGITVNKKPVIGIVYVPQRDAMYTARQGQGAFLNGEKLSVTGAKDLRHSLVITESGSSRNPDEVEKKMKNIHTIVSHSQGVRCYGSAAVNTCLVACGKGDAYYEYGVHVWDFVAAALIAQEAGATVLDPNGEELDIMRRRILVAATPELAKEISSHLDHLDYGTD